MVKYPNFFSIGYREYNVLCYLYDKKIVDIFSLKKDLKIKFSIDILYDLLLNLKRKKLIILHDIEKGIAYDSIAEFNSEAIPLLEFLKKNKFFYPSKLKYSINYDIL